VPMEIESLTDGRGKLVRLSPDTMRLIEAEQRPRETYDQALQRLLGLVERRTEPAGKPG
jgi:hypothetical protein